MKPIKTWVLIADCQRARILQCLGVSKGLEEVPGMVFTASGERGTYPGMQRHPLTSAFSRYRSPIDTPDDPDAPGEAELLEDLASMLDQKMREGAYDRLIVAGSPRALVRLRRHLSPGVRKRLSAEVPEKMMGAREKDVAERLGPMLAA